jgi:hypothetical protein
MAAEHSPPGKPAPQFTAQSSHAVALSAVREEERPGTWSAWRRSPHSTASAWRRCCAGGGRAARPPRTGRYILVGQPESLIICERMESRLFLLRDRWDEDLEAVLLDDLEYVWGPRIRLNR